MTTQPSTCTRPLTESLITWIVGKISAPGALSLAHLFPITMVLFFDGDQAQLCIYIAVGNSLFLSFLFILYHMTGMARNP